MSEQDKDKNKHPFKANAHLLKLLGDQLIGDDRLAIFELVKNAYDADADSVDVTVDLEAEVPNIVVWDHQGDGMCVDTVKNKWLEIGTPSKRGDNRIRTAKGRMPLGEKGVGRLAVHKLGSSLVVNTKSANDKEVRITIDWPQLLSDVTYIEETKVLVVELDEPEYFTNGLTGTRIEVSKLHNKIWQRRDVRKLKRLVTSLQSPFESKQDFSISLDIIGRRQDMKDMLEVEDLLNNAIWKFEFSLDTEGKFEYTYTFNPPKQFKLQSKSKFEESQLELIPLSHDKKRLRKKKNREKILLSGEELEGIGPINGTFYIYSGNRAVLNAQGAYQTLNEYLSDQSGIRIYRDGIRVFNYGEQNDDWLGLNAERINNPSEKTSTSNIIGAISLDLEQSYSLEEKTNREGFDENPTYLLLQHITRSAFEQFEILHLEDRVSLDNATKEPVPSANTEPKTSFDQNIEEIKSVLKDNQLEDHLSGTIARIEKDYRDMRDVTLNAGLAGMNLSVVFHEVEKGVDQLSVDISRKLDYDDLERRAKQLSKVLEGVTPLLKNNEHKKFKISELVSEYFSTMDYRLMMHDIISSKPILTGESPDFEIKAPYGLIRGILNNVVDNAIHWLKLKNEKEGGEFQPAIRVLSLPDWFDEGPALVVLDNGPGMSLPIDMAVQPFKGKRPGGMGLGLYYADQIMMSLRGRLLITTAEELDLDGAYNGVAVALIFNNKALEQ